MTERKQTPDLLGELLGGSAPDPAPAATASAPRAATAKADVGQPAPRPPATKETAPAASKAMALRWEYLVVSFQEYKGWRPRYRNGEKIANWEEQPLLHDLLNQLGAQGWEMTGASAGRALYGSRDEYQIYFKRPPGAGS